MKRYLKTSEEVIDALQEGKEIQDETSIWKLHKGFIVRKNKDSDYWIVNDRIGRHFKGIYIEEPGPLKMEVGKFYKTRNGKKAFIYGEYYGNKKTEYPYSAVIVGAPGSECLVTREGKQLSCKESDTDLVAPWEE